MNNNNETDHEGRPMTYWGGKKSAAPQQATNQEMMEACLRHYDELATLAHCWNNQVPQAIRYWFEHKRALEQNSAAQLTVTDLPGTPNIPAPDKEVVAAELTERMMNEDAEAMFKQSAGEL